MFCNALWLISGILVRNVFEVLVQLHHTMSGRNVIIESTCEHRISLYYIELYRMEEISKKKRKLFNYVHTRR